MRALPLLCAIGLLGGCSLWPRDNPLDPARCSPRCTGEKVCFEGHCVTPDAGGDASPDLRQDLGDGPLPSDAADLTRPDSQPDAGLPPCGSVWSLMSPGTAEHLNAVWGSSSTDVFAVGDKGTILHYDGASWTKTTKGSEALLAIHGTGPTDVYAAGKAGTLLRYDGSSWTFLSAPSTEDYHGIWAVGGEVYVTGWDKVHRYAGSQWMAETVGSGALSAIWGSSKSDIFAAAGQEIYHTDGTGWTLVAGPGAEAYSGLWGNKNAVFAVGVVPISGGGTPPGAIWTYEGGSGTLASDAGGKALRAVWGSTDGPDTERPADVFAVGAAGMVRYYDGSRWNEVQHGKTTQDLNGVWRSDDNQLFVVGNFGAILHHRGPFKLLPRQTTTWLTAIHGASATDVVALGGQGTILRYDGAIWAPVAADSQYYNSVWVSPAGPFYTLSSVGGTFGANVKKYDGTSWSTIHGLDVAASRIWGTGGGELVVAAYKRIEHLTTSWSQHPTTLVNSAVWGNGPGDIYVVGYKGSIHHYDGSAWTEDTSAGVTDDLKAVWGSSATNVYIVGNGGVVLRGSVGSWTKETTTGATQDLTGVWGSGPSDVLVSGARGTVLRHDGSGWSSEITGTSYHLAGIWGSGPTDVHVVGAGGTILGWCGP